MNRTDLTEIYYNEFLDDFLKYFVDEKGDLKELQIKCLKKNRDYIRFEKLAYEDGLSISLDYDKEKYFVFSLLNRTSHSSKSLFYYPLSKKHYIGEYTGNNLKTRDRLNNLRNK